jgi:hypothetical protein
MSTGTQLYTRAQINFGDLTPYLTYRMSFVNHHLIFVSAQIDTDEKDELQKEAEEMNELGIRKLPRDDDGPDPDKVNYLDKLEPVI